VTATLEFTVEERDWNPSAKAGWFVMAEARPDPASAADGAGDRGTAGGRAAPL
jgi:hypothetical protein